MAMKIPTRCPNCEKPLIPLKLNVINSADQIYILCPWCHEKSFLPLKPNGGSNPELHTQVRFNNRNPETGRFERVCDD